MTGVFVDPTRGTLLGGVILGNNVTVADKNVLEEFGQGCTDQQRMFVDNLFTPGMTQKDAAIAAGYAPKSASVSASRVLRLPQVVKYLDVCVNHGIKLHAVNAVNVVNSLSNTANSPYVRLQAAQDILDRAGHKPKEGIAVAVGELTVNIDLT